MAADTYYAIRRELVSELGRGGALHQFQLVQEVWLVPSDNAATVSAAADKMREHPEVQAGLQCVRCEEFTWEAKTA